MNQDEYNDVWQTLQQRYPDFVPTPVDADDYERTLKPLNANYLSEAMYRLRLERN